MNENNGGITFRNINVNAGSSNAGVFIGNTSSIKWKLNQKRNAGLGTIRNNKKGKSTAVQNANYIFDQDIIDHPQRK